MGIRQNSKITLSMPLLCALLYERFHLMEPNIPSAWMKRLMRKVIPNSDFRLFNTSL